MHSRLHTYTSFFTALFGMLLSLLFIGMFLGYSAENTYANEETGTQRETVFCPDGNCGLTQGAEVVKKELDETGVIKDGNIKSTAITVIEYFLQFVGIVLIIIIIISAFKLIVSQGEDDAAENAKKTLLYAFIGVILIVLSYSIVSFITGIADNANENSIENASGIATENSSSTTTTGEESLETGNSEENESITDQGQDILSTVIDLENIVDNGGNIQDSDRTEISEQVDAIYDEAPQSTELQENRNNIINILEELGVNQEQIDTIKEDLKNDPDNKDLLAQLSRLQNTQSNLFDSLKSSVQQFNRTIEKIPEIRAKIAYKYSARTVPVTISLSGDQSYVIQKSKKTPDTLSEHDYYWYAIGPDNKKIELGKKMNTFFEITEDTPGRYTFYLVATLTDENGKPISFPGKAQFSFVAKEPNTQVSFTATGGKESGLQIEYTEDENKKGITFVPHVTPKKGRKILLYQWRFNNRVFETKEEKAVDFTFPNEGENTVILSVTDNAGVKTTVKNRVVIKKAVAYFDLKKYSYQLGEEIFFSGEKSKTTAGYIVEYNWDILDKDNSIIYQSQDEKWSGSFDEPGLYNASLKITDNKGREASYLAPFLVEAKAPKAHFNASIENNGYPATVSFDARKSFDYVDSPLTYSWDFNTDGIFEEEDITSPEIDYTYPDAKKYVATLIVTNRFGKTSSVQKNINIRSTLTAEIKSSASVSHTQTPITFTPTSNTGTAFEWDFGDGRTETSSKKDISHTFSKAGKYKVSLSANDENNKKTRVHTFIFIGEKDTPIALPSLAINGKKTTPTENICGNNTSGYEVLRSDSLSFSADESLNRDGSSRNLKYIWNFPENTIFEKSNIKWKFPDLSEEGECAEVSLQVIDSYTNKKSQSETVFFRIQNALPSISGLTIKEPKSNITPTSITLSAKASDRDGKVVKYSWWATQRGKSQEKVGLHSTSENKTVLIIPRTGEEGDKQAYTFHVEVEDNSGGKIISDDEIGESESFETKTAIDKSPQVSLSQDKKTLKMGDTVVFTAKATDWGNQDINDVATFKWDFDGDNVFDDIDSGSIAPYKYKEFGNFIPRVKVIYKGLATSKEGAVQVEKTEVLPRAAFLYKKTPDRQKNTISFSAQTSTFDKTVTGNALKYEWDFDSNVDSDGDGNSKNDIDSEEKNPQFSYPREQKSAKVTLRILDSVGGSDSVKRNVSFEHISGIVGLSEDINTSPRIWLGANGENGRGLHLTFDELTGKWNNIGDQEFFFNEQSKEWVKLLQKENGETERIAFAFDEDEQKWYDSSTEEQPAGLKLVYDEMLGRWINIGDPAFQFNEETGEWEKFDSAGNIIPESEYKNTKGGQNETGSSENGNLESWEELRQRLKDKINDSLRLLTTTTSTKLDLYGGEKEMTKGEEFQVFAFIKNLDGSLYEGPVTFSVTQGKGSFSEAQVMSIAGRASTLFTAQSIGSVSLQAYAPDTISHALTETLTYEIRDNE